MATPIMTSQSGQLVMAAMPAGSFASGGVVYSNVASGGVISGNVAMSGEVALLNFDQNLIGCKGNEYWRIMSGINSHIQNCEGYSSGDGKRWYIAGMLNRFGGSYECYFQNNSQVQTNIYAYPFLAGRGGKVVEMGMFIATPSTLSGSQFQFGIYDCASGGNYMYPRNLMDASSIIACSSGYITSGALATWAPNSGIFTAGNLYWLVVAGHPTLNGPSAVKTFTSKGVYAIWGHGNDFDNVESTYPIQAIYHRTDSYYSGNWPLMSGGTMRSGGMFPDVSGFLSYNDEVGATNFMLGVRF